MIPFPQTIIVRHRRENLKKCSLAGLEKRRDCLFLTYPLSIPLPQQTYCLLTLEEAPLLSATDTSYPLLLIDGTWRRAHTMEKVVSVGLSVVKRRLPSCRTAYPRRQPDCPNPDRGLASVEALYLAYALLNRPTEGILDDYHWREEFLNQIPFLQERPVDN